MKAPSRLFLAQLTPFTLLCLVALDFLLVWLPAWSVKWYEVVPLALFGLPHGNRSRHQDMVLVRLPYFSEKISKTDDLFASVHCAFSSTMILEHLMTNLNHTTVLAYNS